ncbi:hypothetical protein HW555_000447 [Spodoptera exigua]|uniref:Transposase n=1 Tax=Spodoptera exigua TaxID=7107 RepID=A0A835GUH5_SPOEX|nr:hypothetical protein HW555_000447 [Spodoptera exigua]
MRRTTTAMRNHLKAMHKTEFSELEKCEKRKYDASKTLQLASSSHQSTKSDMKQISLQECIDKTKQWDNKSLKSLAVDKSISEMVALEDLPFSFVESVGFVRLMKHLCPSYNLKSRQYFTSFICDELYGKQWEIPKEKVKCVVRDEGANMKKGVNLLNVKHIDCAAHKIQNVPFDELTKELSSADVSISSVIPLIATLEKIVGDLDATDEYIGDTIAVLKDELIHKFSGLENDLWYATATFIDPKYKSKFFKNMAIKERIIEHILDLVGDNPTDVSANSRGTNAKRVRLNETEDFPTNKRLYKFTMLC